MIVLTPGPCAPWPEVQQALARAPLHHRSPQARSLLHRVQVKLQHFFQTREPVFLMHCTGTGAMEAALINCLPMGATVGVVVSGVFGQRWAQMAQHMGFKVRALQVSWGQAVKPEQVEKFLCQHKVKALLCQAVETSTGVLHPIESMASIVHQHKALFMVDGISALGTSPLKMQAWGIDVLIGASQKALALPAGLAFISFSKKAWSTIKAQHLKNPVGCGKGQQSTSFYFNLQARHYNTQHFSLSMPMVEALDAGLNRFQNLNSMLKQINARACYARIFLQAQGFEFFADVASPALTVVQVPTGMSACKIVKRLAHQYGVQIASGQGVLTEKILRIGHMGFIKPTELKQALQALNVVVHEYFSNR